MKAPAEVPTDTPEHPGHFRVKQFKHQPLLEAAFKTLSQGLARGTFCFLSVISPEDENQQEDREA